MSTTTARQAALQLLLEDVEPLLRQAEAIAASLQTLQGGLQAEAAALAQLLRQGQEAQSATLETARALQQSAQRIEWVVRARDPSALRTGERTAGPVRRWSAVAAVAACGLVIGLVTGLLGAATIGRNADGLREQARIGRALQHAWPQLDPALRQRLQKALDAS